MILRELGKKGCILLAEWPLNKGRAGWAAAHCSYLGLLKEVVGELFHQSAALTVKHPQEAGRRTVEIKGPSAPHLPCPSLVLTPVVGFGVVIMKGL